MGCLPKSSGRCMGTNQFGDCPDCCDRQTAMEFTEQDFAALESVFSPVFDADGVSAIKGGASSIGGAGEIIIWQSFGQTPPGFPQFQATDTFVVPAGGFTDFSVSPTGSHFFVEYRNGAVASTVDSFISMTTKCEKDELDAEFSAEERESSFGNSSIFSSSSGIGLPLVSVGDNGKIATSADCGVTWLQKPSGVIASLQGVATDTSGNIVAVGANGSVLLSGDGGETWDPQANPFAAGIVEDVFHTGSTWIAVGSGDVIAKSADGIVWVQKPTTIDIPLRAVSFGGGLWIATSETGAGKQFGIATSADDGETWQNVNTSGFFAFPVVGISFSGVAFGRGTYVVVGRDLDNAGNTKGRIFVSSDGLNWSETSNHPFSGDVDDGIADVSFGNGVWVAVGHNGKAAFSRNGLTWTPVDAGLGNELINGAHYDPVCDVWVLVANAGRLSTATLRIT